MRPYASLVFPIFRPFSACSHWSCIQYSLSCLADLLTFLHKPLYCCVYSRETFLNCFSLRFSSASFSVSSEIQGFLVVLFAGTVSSTAFLIACLNLLACSYRLHVGSIVSMFFISVALYDCLIFSSLNRFTSTLQHCCGFLYIFLRCSLILHKTSE